jgi:hypothetical protein
VEWEKAPEPLVCISSAHQGRCAKESTRTVPDVIHRIRSTRSHPRSALIRAAGRVRSSNIPSHPRAPCQPLAASRHRSRLKARLHAYGGPQPTPPHTRQLYTMTGQQSGGGRRARREATAAAVCTRVIPTHSPHSRSTHAHEPSPHPEMGTLIWASQVGRRHGGGSFPTPRGHG